jgi:diadenylate cyclase
VSTSDADQSSTSSETESSLSDNDEEISTDSENSEELMIISPNGIQYSYVKEAKDYFEAKDANVKDFFKFSFRNASEHHKVLSDTINNFCKAADDMSETYTGALVVFEKDTILEEIAQTGTRLDAASSTELFNSLFFKNSSLHDGAVVVRDGRVLAAGCILPLTQNSALDSELGTRHRAAIGITEQTDAVAVIVSEENGAISVAKNGELTRGVSSSSLREILLNELATNQEDTAATKKAKKSRKEKRNEK